MERRKNRRFFFVLWNNIDYTFITYLSLKLTNKSVRDSNGFTWFPIMEVAKLFAGIFITVIPALSILKENQAVFADKSNKMYFWLTGILSSFLDNAPTYVVFFTTALGTNDVQWLMETGNTLLAISCGAVFMGAMTYIGNAPNFMVKSISEENQIKMPSFFGFMVWSIIILIPILILTSFIFF